MVMLSNTPAIFSDVPVPESPFSSFENEFTPWDSCELFSSVPHSPTKPVGSNLGSDEPNQSDQYPANSNSCSDDPSRAVSDIDERKRRRMISNRESARRSRMRKQRHLENLRNQVHRLKIENRELTNKLRYVLLHCHSVQTENDRLQSEHSVLRRKLLNIRQVLMFRQLQQQFTSAWPCNIITTEPTPSLIAS
ncbi:hypothetical protein K2173_002489 [Erythroxylum novogranatense]|uniref:BZIP domain-containing protein n=1 Tax=Erythroxylum novogranatense TaxID=1862640 RepID=A0AAV8TQQ7_9ROSI|nr:hypothetical protein K2173_002489 [Erythroxylum novogranatense]